MTTSEVFDQEKVRTVATGLRFPEGGAVDADGSVVVPEIEGAAVKRVRRDGAIEIIASVGGGANGLAFGPDGAIYVCNDGGYVFKETDGQIAPVGIPDDYVGGAIQRVDPATGEVRDVFTECEGGTRLGGLNDIVFDVHGAAYVADTTRGMIHYVDPSAGTIRTAAADLRGPNGAGLSPDGTRLYVSETYTGRVRVFEVTGPGGLRELPDLYQHPDVTYSLDGLAVDGLGHVCVADLRESGIVVLDPEGGGVVARFVTPVRDGNVTNLFFGADNVAYVSAGGQGALYAVPWPWPALRLNFQP
ncbi:hypothetical protein Amsp01_049940 [Amycolatopsis sp. NBRC 101858]|uniref:SMP-30/gluconolactonase/LRE family protein n=1 Tax=Amycolatopsis sp. NBRC 101858 TaxID=3032200 RepID=UPI0024A043E3|nr:SMP-30/gluconolactonase/LRE family protein [Amycolatopsis sp. NBRC 101858]GLY38970.1 hypothetical protein Amsp01_049940 [Amycolatopsis sp. NBRC 101858]